MTKGHAGSVEYFHSEGEFLAKLRCFVNRLELAPGDLEDSGKSLIRSPRTRERLDRVVDLVTGFQSAFGLELLSTVY